MRRGAGRAERAEGAWPTGTPGGKVVSLAEAVRRHVRPGQVIHAGGGWGFPTALLWEVVRQFWGKDPGFTLVVPGAGATNVVPFLRGGLLRRVVSSFAGDGYPHPGPNPIIQEARREARQEGRAARAAAGARTAGPAGTAARPPVEFEDWSLLTLTLRLAAGAMGLPFLPTRSLIGSDLGRDAEAAGLFKVVPDPWGDGAVGLVKALRPDISLTHAWAADPNGNAVFTLPLAGNLYGALAAREGVLLSAERIVDRAYIAAHSDLTRLPADRVLAVVEAPFGAHPTGLHHYGLRETGRGYAEDREFILEVREACGDHAAIDRWIRRWILDLPDHKAYLDRLGPERLRRLQARLAEDAWPADLPEEWRWAGPAPASPAGPAAAFPAGPAVEGPPAAGPPDTPPTPAERLIGLAAGVVADEVRRGGYTGILAGVGASHLACWLARETLAAEGRTVELMAEIGLLGHRPYPGDPFVFSLRNVPTALMTTDALTVLGILVPAPAQARGGGAGRGGRCLGVIGAAQVDRYGNVNSSGVPAAGIWLVGSGGANDVASAADAVVVVAAQSPTRFVPQVPYITSPGDRVVAIVSQWGVFRRPGGPGDEFALAAYFDDPADPAPGPEAAIRRVRDKCGWDLRVLPDPRPLPPPDPAVLRCLRLFDPWGHLRG